MNNEQKNAVQVLRTLLEKLNIQALELDNKREQLRGSIQQIEEASAVKEIAPKVAIEPERPLITVEHSELAAPGPFPYAKIRGMSQPRATIAIARHFNGFLRTKQLTEILVDSGLMKNTKNAASICSRLIRESERFERISEGFYRLRTPDSISPQDAEAQSNTAQLVQ
jgi:hypothetical protein